jgi:hypothetical protein
MRAVGTASGAERGQRAVRATRVVRVGKSGLACQGGKRGVMGSKVWVRKKNESRERERDGTA